MKWFKKRMALWIMTGAMPVLGLPAVDFAYAHVVAARQARWERQVTRDVHGLRAGCEEFTTGQGSTALLMIHGFGDSPAVFGPFASRLAALGFSCRALRLPGAGLPVELARSATHDQWIQAIDDAVFALRKQHAAVWLVGHSLGGALATEYVLSNSNQVDGLILLAPLVEVSSDRSPFLPPETWFRLGQHLHLFVDTLENYFPLDVHDPKARAQVVKERFIPLSQYTELFATVSNIRNQSTRLRLPLLVFLADDDHVIDSLAAERYYAQAQSASARIRWIPNAGHVIPMDYGWQAVADEIAGFVGEAALQPYSPTIANRPSKIANTL
ncbi:MAG: alpha/beta fold hydrolase [Lentisphaerota bacterium]